jgi:predicted enzyme related to lactoylglutathione lyase
MNRGLAMEMAVTVVTVVGLSACGGGGESSQETTISEAAVSRTAGDEGAMFLGLRTVVYQVDDLGEAKLWYSKVLGFEPYFDEPYYVGFNVGGFELGLLPVEGGEALGLGGTLAYWGVEDIEAATTKLLELGASAHGEVQDVGEGIKVASVVDPFGNLLGIIENPYFRLPE